MFDRLHSIQSNHQRTHIGDDLWNILPSGCGTSHLDIRLHCTAVFTEVNQKEGEYLLQTYNMWAGTTDKGTVFIENPRAEFSSCGDFERECFSESKLFRLMLDFE